MSETIVDVMDTAPRPHNSDPKTASEADMIAEAEAEIDAGLFVDEADVDAWVDSLGTDAALPLPKSDAEPSRACRGG